ncbi:hypothetical protein [Klebsiella pneumoniae]|uniref:hypothetical protein n=1 Tax=Klebsiella pneumoniae TaxID=573 RepID=UPI002159DE27|nr:hypothetical protein [Klebsiella pneumoniae]
MAAQNGMSRRDMYTTCVIITVYLWIFPCYGYYEMKKVILFLCQGLEEYEASAFTDAIGWTTTYGMEPVELVTVGLRKKVNLPGISPSNQNINWMKLMVIALMPLPFPAE